MYTCDCLKSNLEVDYRVYAAVYVGVHFLVYM